MSDTEIFDEYSGGRRLNLANSDPQVAEIFRAYLSRVRMAVASASRVVPRLPEIYADSVMNPEFNARAFKHQDRLKKQDRYFIAFNVGLPLIMTGSSPGYTLTSVDIE